MEEQENMERLVNLAKKKDAHAFSLLYEMVYEDLYKMAYYTLKNAHDAEDVVSDTVLDAYAGIEKLKDETAFRGWIFKILSNKCKKKIREYVSDRKNLYADYGEAQLQMEERLFESRNHTEDVVEQDEVEYAFSVLNEEERLIVTMAVYGGYDSGEIAGILHKNRNTVRSKYKRSLEKMQKRLGR